MKTGTKIIESVRSAVCKYGSDHIDVTRDGGNFFVTYHSRNNSFPVHDVGFSAVGVDLDALRGELDRMGVGYDF